MKLKEPCSRHNFHVKTARKAKIAENKKQSERKTFRLFFVYAENVVSCVYESSLETIADERESYQGYINELLIIITKYKIHFIF